MKLDDTVVSIRIDGTLWNWYVCLLASIFVAEAKMILNKSTIPLNQNTIMSANRQESAPNTSNEQQSSGPLSERKSNFTISLDPLSAYLKKESRSSPPISTNDAPTRLSEEGITDRTPEFWELLSTTSISETPEYTHFTMFGDRRRQMIDPTKLAEFWNGYCSLVHKGYGNFCLAERPTDVMPIIIDFVFKFHYDSPRGAMEPLETIKLWDEVFILGIVYSCQQAIRETLNIRGDDDLLCVVLVLEKNWIHDDTLSTQIRIQFPYCKTDVTFQTRLIRPTMIQLLRARNYLSRLAIHPMTDWDNIVDPLTLQEPILMYKSTMLPNRPKLIFEHLYGRVTSEHIESGASPAMELGNFFHISSHMHVQRGLVPGNLFEGQELNYWLPMFLSINYHNVITGTKPTQETRGVEFPTTLPGTGCPAIIRDGDRKGQRCGKSANANGVCGHHRDQVKTVVPSTVATPANSHIEPPEEMIDALVNIIPHNEYLWDLIGHYFHVHDEQMGGLSEWIEFTLKHKLGYMEGNTEKVYTREDCEKRYIEISDTINEFESLDSIYHKLMQIAKHHSKPVFEVFANEYGLPLMNEALSCLHTDVAVLVAFRYFDQYAYHDQTKTWYQRFDTEWRPNRDRLRFAKTDLYNYVNRWKSDISRQIEECNDPSLKLTLENKLKKIQTLSAKLKTVSYWNNIIKETSSIIHRGISFRPTRHDQRNLPYQEVVGYINIFIPYKFRAGSGKCTDAELNKIQPHLDLLLDITGGPVKITVADNDGKLKLVNFTYVRNYLADIVQNPHKKPGVALVFVGPQDAGKGTFWEDFFALLILGLEHYFPTSDIMQIVGHFNAAIAGKTLIITDEAKAHFNGEWGMISEGLKRNITCPVQSIEKKGHDPVAVESNARYVFLNNPENPLHFVQNDKRRFCIFECLGTHCGDKKFWTHFHKNYVTQECANIFAKYLLSIDLTDFIITEFPKTDFRNDILDRSLPPFERFFKENTIKDANKKIDRMVVAKAYVKWAEENRETLKITNHTIYNKIKAMGFGDPIPSKSVYYFHGFTLKPEIMNNYFPQSIQETKGTGVDQMPQSIQGSDAQTTSPNIVHDPVIAPTEEHGRQKKERETIVERQQTDEEFLKRYKKAMALLEQQEDMERLNKESPQT